MKTTFEKNVRFARLFTVAAAVAVGSWACSEAETREAPADADEAAPEAMAADQDEAQMPTQEAPAPARDAAAAQPDEAAQAEAPPPSERPPVEETPEPVTVPTGTPMTFAVQEEISTDRYDVGDFFVAELTDPVFDAQGNLLLDAGAPSEWVVTEATTEDGQALLAVALESIKVNGAWIPVAATVSEAELDTDNPDSGGETAAKIGVGAAAGALVGQILGKDTESTLKGAGVGAAVGTAVALATRGGSAKLPAGSLLTVRLDEPMTIS